MLGTGQCQFEPMCPLYIHTYMCIYIYVGGSDTDVRDRDSRVSEIFCSFDKTIQLSNEVTILVNYVPVGIVSIGGGYQH